MAGAGTGKYEGLTMDALVRVSRDGGRSKTDSFYSPTDQQAQLALAAADLGVTIGETVTEINFSGGDMARPGLMGCVTRIEAGVSDGLLIAKLDRFGRDTIGMLQLERRIREAGGKLVILDAEYDVSTPEGETMFTVSSAFATQTRRNIERSWERAHRTHVMEHSVPVSCPFGYRRREQMNLPLIEGVHRKTLVRYPKEAKWVVKIFEWRASGVAFGEIAGRLNRARVKTKKGAAWTGGSVSATIKSRTYRGEVRFGKKTPLVKLGAHEALVDEELWQGARLGGRRPSDKYHGQSLLTGLVRCAGCRYKLESSGAMNRYRCARKHAGGVCPDPVTITRSVLDDYVWAYMEARAREERLGWQMGDQHADVEIEAELAKARRSEEAHHANLDAIAIIGQAKWNTIAGQHRNRVLDFEAKLLKVGRARLTEGFDWSTILDAPLEERRAALHDGIDVIFLRASTSDTARVGNTYGLDIAERTLILERSEGPTREQLPRRGPRTPCEFACVPFPFPDDDAGAVVLDSHDVSEGLHERLGT